MNAELYEFVSQLTEWHEAKVSNLKTIAKLRQLCAECDAELAAGRGMGTRDIELALTKRLPALAG